MRERRQARSDATVGGSSSVRHVLLLTSTFPASADDPVPGFVRDFVEATAAADPNLRFTVLAPRGSDPRQARRQRHPAYDEYRFSYMWPPRLQVLTSRGGIVPSLRRNPLLFVLVPFFMIGQFVALVRLGRRLRPDVVNAHWVIPQGVVAAWASRWSRLPLLMTVHGGDVFTFNSRWAIAVKRAAFRRARLVVVNSSATLARTIEIGGAQTVLTIPMGADLGHFGRARHHRPPGLRVLFVGRLSEEKGVNDLIGALALLRDRGVPFTARIVGRGQAEGELRAAVCDAGIESQVEFCGWASRDQLVDHYRWASVFVGPSIQSRSGWVEALGVVFIEAAAAGLPVITTRTGGIQDVVIDGVTGYIVGQRDPDAIADRLARLHDQTSLVNVFGESAAHHVAGRFSWQSVGEAYAQAFREV